jgi:predicted lipid-binding transport protein (Tim44 family)
MPAQGVTDWGASDSKVTASGAGLPRNIPADFDQEGFVRIAKANFVRLQLANDAADLDDLREFTTPEMYAELKMDIADRQGAIQWTDVVSLKAELLEVVDEMTHHLAAIRFHGLIRESSDAPSLPFDEVWHLSKPADGSRGWLVAGIQQLK